MPRIARAILPGFPHHVTQRGNFRQAIFDDDIDRQRYLNYLQTYKQKYGLSIWAYCLMDNHIHLLCVPATETSLGNASRDTHMRYASYYNRKHCQQGHLWQGRFNCCICDEPHMWSAVRYIERNPVKAGIVKRAEAYRWSSAASNVAGELGYFLDVGLPVEDQPDMLADWSGWLNTEYGDEAMVNSLRENTATGRPCGKSSFIEQVEALLGRNLKAKPHGRPRKN